MNRVSLAIVAEPALIVGIVASVLCFGGTEPVSFAAVELLFFGLAVWMAIERGTMASVRPLYFVVPVLLAVWVFFQLCPLPAGLGRALAIRRGVYSASTVLSAAPYETRAELLILLTCFVAFYLALYVSGERNRRRRLVYALILLGLGEAFYGLIQYLANWQTIWWYAKKYDLEEATGTYINRNHFAGFLEMIVPFAVCLALYQGEKLAPHHAHRLRRAKKAGPHVSRVAFWLAVAVVQMAALVFSRSRMGLLAACASLLVLFGLNAFERRTVPIRVTLAFLVLSFGFATWIGLRPALTRFENLGSEFSGQETRLSIWPGAVRLIREHPLVGNGLGTFPVAYTPFQTAFLTKFVNHAHNDYLEFASDLGLPAAVALFGSIAFVLVRAAQTFFTTQSRFDRNASLACVGSIVAILLHSLTDFNLHIPANALVFVVILGIALASGADAAPAEAKP